MINNVTEFRQENLTIAGDFTSASQPEDRLSADGIIHSAMPKSTIEAIENFLNAPSFSTKQLALESFLKQISQGNSALVQNSGTQ